MDELPEHLAHLLCCTLHLIGDPPTLWFAQNKEHGARWHPIAKVWPLLTEQERNTLAAAALVIPEYVRISGQVGSLKVIYHDVNKVAVYKDGDITLIVSSRKPFQQLENEDD